MASDPRLPDEAEFERLLRERYEPILTGDDYRRLRQACGLGDVVDGVAYDVRTVDGLPGGVSAMMIAPAENPRDAAPIERRAVVLRNLGGEVRRV